MKKITAILAFLLMVMPLAMLLTGCEKNEGLSDSGDSFAVDSGESKGENSDGDSLSLADRSLRRVYGEAEIPDFHAGDIYHAGVWLEDDGRGNLTEEEIVETFGSMVFETQEIGDYKYSLVGENVRIDSENYSGFIYMTDLYIEVEKGGAVTGKAEYSPRDEYGFRLTDEELADPEWSYFNVYEMDYPIIAAINYPLWKGFEVEFFAVKDGSPVKLTGDFSDVGGGKSVTVIQDNVFGFYKPSAENTILNVESGRRFTFDPDKIADGSAPQYTVENYYKRDSDISECPDYVRDSFDEVSLAYEWIEDFEIVFPTEFTEDDLALQEFLKETSGGANFLVGMIHDGIPTDDPKCWDRRFVFPQNEEPIEEQVKQCYYPLADVYPKSVEELREQLSEYFTEDIVNSIMHRTGKGEFTENEDGTYSWNITEGSFDSEGHLEFAPNLIECDGRFFRDDGIGTSRIDGYWDSVRIISKTETDIVFTCVYGYTGGLGYVTGHLVYEDGWKYSWQTFWKF